MADGSELTLLDTHVWVWSVVKHPNLSAAHAEIIERERENLAISVVSCWEISMLVAKGRLRFPIPLLEWFENAILDSNTRVIPLSYPITVDAYSLPGRFHDDPADRMIVATARSRDCLLLTEDEKIIKYPHVRTA